MAFAHCLLICYVSALRVKRSEDDVDKDDAEVATLLQKKGEGEWQRRQCHQYPHLILQPVSLISALIQV